MTHISNWKVSLGHSIHVNNKNNMPLDFKPLRFNECVTVCRDFHYLGPQKGSIRTRVSTIHFLHVILFVRDPKFYY